MPTISKPYPKQNIFLYNLNLNYLQVELKLRNEFKFPLVKVSLYFRLAPETLLAQSQPE
jgi:hypothetical protein